MVQKTGNPIGWPDDVLFIDKPTYCPRIDKGARSMTASQSSIPPMSACKLVRIRLISQQNHPSFGQRGLFCLKAIPAGTHILDYLGEVHTDDRPESDYDVSLLRYATQAPSKDEDGGQGNIVCIGVDAHRMGNEARFINDYRGTGVPKPNAEFRERHYDGELRMSVWSGSRGIKKGEEILLSYGKSWWKARGNAGDIASSIE